MAAALTADPKSHFELCGICEGRYKEPKMLNCMHNFCEKCLEKYFSGRSRGAVRIPCPECQEETELPEKGIQGLTTNYHLISKFEKSLQEKVAQARSSEESLICETCEEGKEAKYCCLDCEQNICSDCQRRHLKIAVAAGHTTAALDDIHQGKGVLKTEDGGSRCHKHKEEMKTLYCKTCEELLCQVCTTEDSCCSHNYMDSETASAECKNSLTELFPVITEHIQELEGSLAAINQNRQELTNEMEIMIQDVKDGAAKIAEKIADQEKGFINEIKTAENSHCKLIDEHKEAVTKVLQRAQYSLDTATDIESTASESHFLSLYPTINMTLKSLSNLKPPSTDKKHSHLKFRENPDVENISLGKLDLEFKWQMCAEYKPSLAAGRSFSSTSGIAALPNEIAVACDWRYIVILSTKGHHKKTIELDTSRSWGPVLGIAATPYQFVIVDGTKHIQWYIKDSPQSYSKFSTIDYTTNLGIATVQPVSVVIKNDGTLVVGDIKRKVLTVHKPKNYSVILTIQLNIAPSYLAIHKQDTLVACDADEAKVAVIKDNGDTVFTIEPTISEEEGVKCKGVCCDSSAIYVAVCGTDDDTGHIHRYDATNGVFLSCIIQDLYQPSGITFTADGLQLAVADTESVKMYHKV